MGMFRDRPIGKWFLGGVAAGVALLAVAWSAMSATDQRPFCASCHLMEEAAVTHKLGTHANQSCNDCHTPHHLLAKLPFKAKDGLRDFAMNLWGRDLEYPPSEGTRRVINDNCIACHAETNQRVASMAAKAYCVDCHRGVAHMRLMPVSTRMVAYE